MRFELLRRSAIPPAAEEEHDRRAFIGRFVTVRFEDVQEQHNVADLLIDLRASACEFVRRLFRGNPLVGKEKDKSCQQSSLLARQ